jgi:hypothetical protein
MGPIGLMGTYGTHYAFRPAIVSAIPPNIITARNQQSRRHNFRQQHHTTKRCDHRNRELQHGGPSRGVMFQRRIPDCISDSRRDRAGEDRENDTARRQLDL